MYAKHLYELSSNICKCLFFVQVLTSCKDKEICSWILTKIEQVPQLPYRKWQKNVKEYEIFRHGTAKIEFVPVQTERQKLAKTSFQGLLSIKKKKTFNVERGLENVTANQSVEQLQDILMQ